MVVPLDGVGFSRSAGAGGRGRRIRGTGTAPASFLPREALPQMRPLRLPKRSSFLRRHENLDNGARLFVISDRSSRW